MLGPGPVGFLKNLQFVDTTLFEPFGGKASLRACHSVSFPCRGWAPGVPNGGYWGTGGAQWTPLPGKGVPNEHPPNVSGGVRDGRGTCQNVSLFRMVRVFVAVSGSMRFGQNADFETFLTVFDNHMIWRPSGLACMVWRGLTNGFGWFRSYEASRAWLKGPILGVIMALPQASFVCNIAKLSCSSAPSSKVEGKPEKEKKNKDRKVQDSLVPFRHFLYPNYFRNPSNSFEQFPIFSEPCSGIIFRAIRFRAPCF